MDITSTQTEIHSFDMRDELGISLRMEIKDGNFEDVMIHMNGESLRIDSAEDLRAITIGLNKLIDKLDSK